MIQNIWFVCPAVQKHPLPAVWSFKGRLLQNLWLDFSMRCCWILHGLSESFTSDWLLCSSFGLTLMQLYIWPVNNFLFLFFNMSTWSQEMFGLLLTAASPSAHLVQYKLFWFAALKTKYLMDVCWSSANTHLLPSFSLYLNAPICSHLQFLGCLTWLLFGNPKISYSKLSNVRHTVVNCCCNWISAFNQVLCILGMTVCINVDFCEA